MAKWRFSPLLLTAGAALAALSNEPGSLARELASLLSFSAFVLFLLLFATRH